MQGKQKELKQARRFLVAQTHVRVLLLNKLNSILMVPPFEGYESICEMIQTPLILDGDENIRDDEKESVPESGKICLMHLVERYVEGNIRAEHSELVMKMGLILSSHGSTGYDLLHPLFGFPSLVSIWRHFHSDLIRCVVR
jgi:hypothetical protein